MPRRIKTTERIARREYWCQDCGLQIRPGDLHYVTLYADDSEIYDWRSHPGCHILGQLLYSDDYMEGWLLELVRDLEVTEEEVTKRWTCRYESPLWITPAQHEWRWVIHRLRKIATHNTDPQESL